MKTGFAFILSLLVFIAGLFVVPYAAGMAGVTLGFLSVVVSFGCAIAVFVKVS